MLHSNIQNTVLDFVSMRQMENTNQTDPTKINETFLEALSVHFLRISDNAAGQQHAQRLSYALRKAFRFSAEALPELPLQLGQDHKKAKAYFETAIATWAATKDMYTLYSMLKLPSNHCAVFIDNLSAIIPIDELAIWLCDEFGHLRTKRQALHCRRYLAAKITNQILSETGRPRANRTLHPDVLQNQLNTWSNPMVSMKESLHYQQVILPIFNRIKEISETKTAPI